MCLYKCGYTFNLTFTIINRRLDFIFMYIKFIVNPQFNIGDRKVTEGGTLAVRLSAEALTDPLFLTPGLDTSGYIEADVILEQGTTQPFALFGMLTAHTCLIHEVIHLYTYLQELTTSIVTMPQAQYLLCVLLLAKPIQPK